MTDQKPPVDINSLSDAEIEAHMAERKAMRKAAVEKIKPAVTEVLLKEGGQWVVWAANEARLDPKHAENGGYTSVHAIKFDDGTIWDCVFGWRG
jgi:hypothetical protein